MKKLFFLTALLCASLMGFATNYCQTQVSTSQEAIDVTVKQTGPLQTTFIFEGEKLANREEWQGFNPINLGGGTLSGENLSASTTITYTNGKLTCVTTWTTYPTSNMTIYFSLYRDNSVEGSDIMTFTLNDINPKALCTPDSEKPVMGEASLASVTGNSAVINVTATDNIGVTKYHVVNTSPAVDVELTPSAGTITVTGLTESTTYNFTITAKDDAGNESENNASVEATTTNYATAPSTAATAPTWPDIQVKALYSPTYNADYTHQDWSSGTVHSKDEFGHKYVTNANGYFGADGFNHNCVGMEKLHYDIWIADNATIRIVPICRNDADSGNEPEVGKTVSLTGQQWNSIDLDLATDYSAVKNWKHVYQVKIDEARDLTFWVGNAYFYTTVDPTADTQKPTGVTASLASVDFFSATLTVRATDNSGTVNYIVKNGETEVASGSGASGENATIKVNNLTPGTAYSFNVIAKDVAGNEANPVEVEATTTATPSPAALPTYAAEDVKGVYTDNYTDVAMGIQDWYAGPAVTTVSLAAGREALYITPNATSSSCFGLAFPATDITAYNNLEMDVYPAAENAVLTIQVIGVSERTTYNLAANEWNHISLSIAGNTKTNCEQIGFYDCNNLIGVTFVQNVLFVQNGGTTAIENAEVSAKAIKMFENGQLIIIKNGVRYSALGNEIK